MDSKKINERFVKISSSPILIGQEISPDQDIKILLECSHIQETYNNLQDGNFDVIYKVKGVNAVVINSGHEVISE